MPPHSSHPPAKPRRSRSTFVFVCLGLAPLWNRMNGVPRRDASSAPRTLSRPPDPHRCSPGRRFPPRRPSLPLPEASTRLPVPLALSPPLPPSPPLPSIPLRLRSPRPPRHCGPLQSPRPPSKFSRVASALRRSRAPSPPSPRLRRGSRPAPRRRSATRPPDAVRARAREAGSLPRNRPARDRPADLALPSRSLARPSRLDPRRPGPRRTRNVCGPLVPTRVSAQRGCRSSALPARSPFRGTARAPSRPPAPSPRSPPPPSASLLPPRPRSGRRAHPRHAALRPRLCIINARIWGCTEAVDGAHRDPPRGSVS